jgi:hypothetical protein
MGARIFAFFAIWAMGEFRDIHAQILDLSLESMRQREVIQVEYPQEIWEMQQVVSSPREFKKPIQLSNKTKEISTSVEIKELKIPNSAPPVLENSPSNGPGNLSLYSNKVETEQNEPIQIELKPALVLEEESVKAPLPVIDLDSTSSAERKSALNVQEDKLISKYPVLNEVGSVPKSTDLIVPEIPKELTVKSAPPTNKSEEKTSVKPLAQKPVITSLDKKVPSLTAFRPQSNSSNQPLLLENNSYYFSEESLFPKLLDISKWTPVPSLVQAIQKPEDILAFTRKWNPTLLQEIADSIGSYAQYIKLNDAGIYLYTSEVSGRFYPTNPNAAKIITAILMQKLGFRVHSVIRGNEIALMVNTRQKLYEVPRLQAQNFESEEWYLWQPKEKETSSGNIMTPGMSALIPFKALDLNIYEMPNWGAANLVKKIIYTDAVSKTKDTFEIRLNSEYIKFLGALPQMSPEVYFNAVVSKELQESLIAQLKIRLSTFRSYEALGWLLRFVQNAFPYQTDELQFRKEKAMFIEESVVYPFTDCEDRSVLFGILVREVLNREVIGLDFPGHMAVAVQTPKKEARGALLRYNGKIFMACDPSYKRAIPGSLPENILKQTPVPVPVRKIGG